MELRPDADYQAHLKAGRFMLLRSKASGRCFFYPRVAEPGTGNTDLEWVEAGGVGKVYSVTVIRAKPPQPSYNVALVDLAEGPRLMSRIEGIGFDQVKIGMEVRARIVSEDEQYYVVFEPAS